MSAPTICFVTNEISPGTKGGIGRLITEVSHDLYKAGWSILFLLDVDGDALDEIRAYLASEMPGAECFSVEELLDNLSSDEDIPFWAFRFPPYHTSYRVALALRKLCERREIGGIEFNDYVGLGYVTLRWRRLWGETFSGIKMWVRLHGSKELWERADDRLDYSIGGQQLYNMERYVLKHADAWVAPSAAITSWYSEHYGITRPSFCKAPSFDKIGPPNVHPRQVTGTLKKILFFGKLQRLKGADIFVRAAVRLCEETDQPLEFEVIGHDEPLSWKYGSFQKELEAMIPSRYQDHFHFRGWIALQNLPAIARECILAVVPSRVETFCLAAHELNWIGIPLVLNDIPAFKEHFTDGQNCRKFDGTAEGLAEIVKEILGKSNPFEDWTWDADRIDTDPLPLYQDLLDRCYPFTPASRFSKARPPLVTVVVPYYNMQDYVDDTVDSVLNSTYPNWEMILIDDGSPAPKAIAKFEELQRRFAADDRIRFLQKPNGGLGDTCNYGIKHAKGQYILPLDSDDVIHPEYIERAVIALERNPDLDATSCYVSFFLDGQPHDQIVDYGIPYDLIPHLIVLENRAGVAGSVFRRSVFDRFSYNDSLFAYEDWDLWWQMAEAGCQVETMPMILYRYRRRQDSVNVIGVSRHSYLVGQISEMHPQFIQRMNPTLFRAYLEELFQLQQDLSARQASLTQLQARLQAIENSLTWRIGSRLAYSLPGRIAGWVLRKLKRE